MIVRSKECSTVEEKQEIAKLSLDYGKRAIGVDLKDSDSWYTYGNAYFFKAFIDNTQYEDLKYALGSYNKAESLQDKHKNPDLFYNRAVVHAYLENYNEAYKDFISANEIDANLKASDLADNILTNTIQTCKFIKNQVSLKPKKLSQILSTIPTNVKDNIEYSLSKVNCELLSLGVNKNKLISAKIVQLITTSFEVPISFICVDHDGNFFSLSVYNISKSILETIKPFATNVVILDPVYKLINFSTIPEKNYEYPCIQVSNLQTLLIEGKFCSNFLSTSQLNSTFFN
jgi:tetratricopeptide (TPR) repeat protein